MSQLSYVSTIVGAGLATI